MNTIDLSRPIQPSERILLPDALRGFALLGILFVNMTWFTGYAVLDNEGRAALATGPLDEILHCVIQFAVDGKFWSLFALLFGAGFAMQVSRAEADGRDIVRLHLRRMLVLLAIGLAHAVFLWFGDIVSIYAVVGLCLPFFRRWSDAALLRGATAMLLLPVAVSTGWLMMYQWAGGNHGGAADPGHGPAAMLPHFAAGNYADVVTANWAFLTRRWFLALYTGRFLKILGMFLLGMYIAKTAAQTPTQRRTHRLRTTLIVGFLLGIPLNAVATWMAHDVTLDPPSPAGVALLAVKAVGVPALCVAYGAALTLLFAAPAGRRLAHWFAPVGRMSFTNYLLQTVVGIALFYGCGAGLWGRFGPSSSLLFIVILYAMQVRLSRMWLALFPFGPVEWLCRVMTYRENQLRPIANC